MNEDKKIVEFFASGLVRLLNMVSYEVKTYGSEPGFLGVIFYDAGDKDRRETLRVKIIQYQEIFDVNVGFQINSTKDN